MLFAILAPLALECIVRVAHCLCVEIEQLAKVVLGEMASCVFCFIHHTGGQVLLLTSEGSVKLF